MKFLHALLAAALLSANPLIGLGEESQGDASAPYHDAAARAQWREQLVNRAIEELGLSIEQRAVLADIMGDYGPRLFELMKQGANIGWSVLDVAPKNPQYAVDTEATAQAAAEAAAQWVRTMAEFRNAIYSILSQQQIALLEERLQARRDAWRQRLEATADQQEPAASD